MSEGLRVTLHPLPILNISEHLTRVSLQQNDTNVRVVGGLLGTQFGRDIEIMNSFEIVCAPNPDGVLTVDQDYFVTRRDQFKQVFPTFDVVGWYSIGSTPTDDDIALHKQFFEYNENPLFLQLARTNARAGKQLPVTIYESVVEIVSAETKTVFIPTSYEIETGEAERVAVDHVAKPSDSNSAGTQSSLVASLTTQRNAIKMLHDRVNVIVRYLEAVQAGTAPKDPETLRQISALLASLQQQQDESATTTTTEGDDEFKDEFMTEYNDVMLTTYLAAMTKNLHAANDLLDKQLLFLSGNGTNVSRGGGAGEGGAVGERGERAGAAAVSSTRRRGPVKDRSDFF